MEPFYWTLLGYVSGLLTALAIAKVIAAGTVCEVCRKELCQPMTLGEIEEFERDA